jgi:hypothetical protein
LPRLKKQLVPCEPVSNIPISFRTPLSGGAHDGDAGGVDANRDGDANGGGGASRNNLAM